ncbi:hypothetical protein N0V90_001615 [Kalmusia sp. IMI 367209]|nr:hypothetical protein N0V90_001615 [Kalmusia sp. IMI 367209]
MAEKTGLALQTTESNAEVNTFPLRLPPESLRHLSSEELKQGERRLVRRIDCRLMATLIIIYIMNYLDRNAIAAAKISGIEDDLGLTDSQFQTSVSILFVGCMAVWGILCGATGAVQGFGGLVACRFLLGFVEAAYFGAITVAIALISFLILPDFPANTRWIIGQERDLAQWRLVADVGQDDWVSSEEECFFLGFKQCVTDYKTWFLILLIFGAVSSGTINSYFPTVVATLGYGKTETLLLTAPPYLLSCVVALLVSFNADRTGERYFHFTIPLWTSIAGFIISASVVELPTRYFSMMIMLPGVYTAFTIGLTWAANTLPRPPAKRAATMALCNCIANCSSIYGPFLYPKSTAPRYLIAMGINAGTSLISIIVATVFRFVLVRLNKKIDVIEGTAPSAQSAAMGEKGSKDEHALAAKGFRYLY